MDATTISSRLREGEARWHDPSILLSRVCTSGWIGAARDVDEAQGYERPKKTKQNEKKRPAKERLRNDTGKKKHTPRAWQVSLRFGFRGVRKGGGLIRSLTART